MKYAFMQNHADEFKITSMSRVLGVSRSGFYRWRQRGEQPTRRQQQRLALDKLVADAFVARKTRASSPSLVPDLHDQGHAYDRKTVAASMKRQHLRAKAARKYKATTNSRHNLPVAPNLLQRDFSAETPNPEVGKRNNLSLDRLRLAVPCRDYRSVFTAGSWLGFGRAYDRRSCLPGFADGTLATENAQRGHPAFRPRQPILFYRISKSHDATSTGL